MKIVSWMSFTRAGWKVHRLTKELCSSNETWHALNSTFPDTKLHCFLPDKPTLDKYFRTLKSSTRDISEIAWKTDNGERESYFTRTMFLPTSLWLQWLLCMTVALNWLITLHIHLIWHHLTIFCSPTWKNTWLGSSIGPMMKSYSLPLRTFFFCFYTTGIQALQHWWKKCLDRRGDWYPFHIKPIMRSQRRFENNAIWCERSEAALFDTGVRKAAFDVGGLLLPQEAFGSVFWPNAAVCDGAVISVKWCTK